MQHRHSDLRHMLQSWHPQVAGWLSPCTLALAEDLCIIRYTISGCWSGLKTDHTLFSRLTVLSFCPAATCGNGAKAANGNCNCASGSVGAADANNNFVCLNGMLRLQAISWLQCRTLPY